MIGNRKSKFELKNTDNVDKHDEIELYLRGRMLCSMDCMWRILGFQNYPAPQPTVTLIKAKLPEDIKLILEDQKVCDLAVYLARPQNDIFENLLYAIF